MRNKLKLAMVDPKYCDYLRNYDSKVPYNNGNKEKGPFIGVLFVINGLKYFAPLSSPKLKHLKMKNVIDFLKIDGGKLGAVNFNNMLSLIESSIKIVDLNDNNLNYYDKKYIILLKHQFFWLKRNEDILYKKSINLYNKYVLNKLDKKIKKRCLDFKLLEEKSKFYNQGKE